MNLKAILYDFDGTTVNTEKLHFETWNKTLSQFNITIDELDYLNNYAGVPTPQNSKAIIRLNKLNICAIDLTNQRQTNLISKLQNYKAEYMPFAVESIDFFKSKKTRVSNSNRKPKREYL